MSKEEPKFKKVIVAADGLSVGISIVVAIAIGVGIGYLMRKWFGYEWLFWLGVAWGIAAAVLNVYKAYEREKRDLDEIAKDPRYSRKRYDASDEGS